MIYYLDSDLFSSPAKVLVNTVNLEGVMGKGIAKTFKQLFPDMFKAYQDVCERKIFNIGQLHLFKTKNKWILNFPTKTTWRAPSKIEYIEAGLKKFVETYREKRLLSVSFPMLGCGNGELNWEQQVKPLMEKYLTQLPVEIFIHLYKNNGAPEHSDIGEMTRWLTEEPVSLPFAEVWHAFAERIAQSPVFTNIYSGNQFTAATITLPPDDEDISSDAVKVTTNGIETILQYEQLMNFWQSLRDSGVFRIFNDFLSDEDKYLASIFSTLPYVKPVTMYSHSGHETIGLTLVPHKRDVTRIRPAAELEEAYA